MSIIIKDYNSVDIHEKERFYCALEDIGINEFNADTLQYAGLAIGTHIDLIGSDLMYDIEIYNKHNRLNTEVSITASTFISILLENNIDSYFSGDRSIIKEDINIYKEIMNDDGTEYQKYLNFRVKCEMLGVECNIFEKDGKNYIAKKLIPDENGIVTIPDFVNNITPDAGYNDAKGERYLYSKIIWKQPRVMSLGGIFSYNSTKALDLTEFNISRIPDISVAFSSCSNLKKVSFGNNDFRNTVFCGGLFAGCNNLDVVKMNNAKMSRCKSEYSFGNIIDSPKLTFASLGSIVYRATAAKATFSDVSRHDSIILGNRCGKGTKTDLMIKLGKSSIPGILNLPNNNENMIVYLDELTGINFIGAYLKGMNKALNNLIFDFQDLNDECYIADENNTLQKIYEVFFNQDIALYFCNKVKHFSCGKERDNYITSTTCRGKISTYLYYRSVLPVKIEKIKYIERYDKNEYKYRLIFSKMQLNFPCKNNEINLSNQYIIVYFNNYSEWSIQDLLEYKTYSKKN